MNRQIPWPRVFVEGVVIVVSILLAFGLQAWWEGSQERERERVYVEALQEDLRSTVADTEAALAAESQLLEWVDKVLVGFDADPLPPGDSLAFWLENTLRSLSFHPPAATVDALIQTGDISILGDAQLRRSVMQYRERMQGALRAFNTFDEAGLDAVASINRRINRRAILLGTNPSRYPVNWEGIAADSIVRGDLWTHRIAVRQRRAASEELFEASLSLQELIEGGQGR